MAVLRQAWTLTKKNLLVVFVRHWFFTTIRAFLAPVIFVSLGSRRGKPTVNTTKGPPSSNLNFF